MFDVLIVGGGAIGLLTAYELARRGGPITRIAVCDKGEFGQEASWAGAGIVPPGTGKSSPPGDLIGEHVHPIDRLRGYSIERFHSLTAELLSETGIDIEFHRTGGLELALDDETADELRSLVSVWDELGIDYEQVSGNRLRDIEPNLVGEPIDAYWFPEMMQVRNPRLMQALEAACRKLGIVLLPRCEIESFATNGEHRVDGVVLSGGKILEAEKVVVAAGAWSQPLLAKAGITLPLSPVHGQIVALQTDRRVVDRIVLAGKSYLVPRSDGVVLVGSTEEDFGFEKRNTPAATTELLEFAHRLFPRLTESSILKCWSGLRPGTALDHPLLGRVGQWENVWMAAGHFRRGIQLSPATARLLVDWIVGEPSIFSEETFSVSACFSGRPSFSS